MQSLRPNVSASHPAIRSGVSARFFQSSGTWGLINRRRARRRELEEKQKDRLKEREKEVKRDEKKDTKSSDNQNSQKSGGSGGKDQGPKLYVREFKIPSGSELFMALLVLSLLVSLYGLASDASSKEITWQEFKAQYLDRGLVSSLKVVNRQAVIATTTSGENLFFSIGSVDSFERRLEDAQNALGVKAQDRIPVVYAEEGKIMSSILSLLPTLLLLGFLFWMARRATGGAGSKDGPGGIFGMGQSRAKLFNAMTDVKIKFDDVAGMNEAKQEIMEFVQFLKDPQKYEELGAKIPRGAILSGSPGTGKTLIAKATAGEAGVPFFSVSGSEFIEMFSGVGASRVRDLFKKAKEVAPSIIFIDEIDAIGKARGKSSFRGSNDEREATLNQLLVEMDGFDSDQHVVVLAGTNRPDVLDKALLRPGRFDRHIHIDLPTIDGRKAIFEVHLKKIKFDHTISQLAGKLAAMTPGFAGADIANCCNEAALIAARRGSEVINMDHFEAAIDRVIAGLAKKTRVLKPEKRKVVAYHEAGHAICGWFLKYADPLVKVSIIPHGASTLGYAQYLPPDQYLVTEEQFKDRMAMTLGGRVSEEINFQNVTVGGSDDFMKVTQMATGMVTKYGMSPELGQVTLARSEGTVTKPYSEETGKMIDQEVRRIVREAHERCTQLLTEKKEQVAIVAEELLSKEVITRQDMIRLLGPRPFPERNDAFDKYLSEELGAAKKDGEASTA